ncbi:TRNA-dihydrouridine synthase [Phytophthora megakarya]|uniref:tRNA-dihydrouridine synthase n=1 Tax=Phytophthora megakarya TaxID=4795 RepID=A0A225VGS1_9STRA|nr:TRNA-dihydrouridine synthase [Phytophthora megakarya]
MAALPPVARLSVAPMMDWTDRHYRFMMRMITKETLLFTEMVVDQTLLHQKKNLNYFLGHDPAEAPLALQLGGNSVEDLGAAAHLSQSYGGFCEINLNTGCPSALVSSRCFGARLMLEPERVRDICNSMRRNVALAAEENPEQPVAEVTVKCRIGVDDCDSYEELHHYVASVASAGVRHIIVHARKCLLKGLSTKDNRTIPPLRYEFVYRLKQDFPELSFTLNGGVQSIQHARELLDTTNVDGIMIYNPPWNFRDADRLIFNTERNPNLSRREIIERYLEYAEDLQATWGSTVPLSDSPYTMATSALMKPLLALFKYGILLLYMKTAFDTDMLW